MDRREIIKLGALTIGQLTVPDLKGLKSFKQTESETINQAHIMLKLNNIELFIFSDGYYTLSNPQPVFAPEINLTEVKKELKKIYLKQDKMEGSINVILIKKENSIILVDTGSGYHFGETGGWLSKNLEKAGIKPSDVTDIFITHAHVDHIGGIFKKDKSPVYPNAKYYIAKQEYNFWMSKNPDFSKSKNPQNPSASIDIAQEILSLIKDKLVLFNYEDVLFSCIKTELAEGHTPGHTVFTIFSGDKSIKHIVDTAHTPLLIAKPEWGTQWDVDFNKGVRTRKKILENSFLNRTLVMATHLPWPGLGYIGKNGNTYQWQPFAYFTPNEIIL